MRLRRRQFLQFAGAAAAAPGFFLSRLGARLSDAAGAL